MRKLLIHPILLALLASLATTPADAEGPARPGVTAERAWTRAAGAGQTGVGYLTLRNGGGTEDRLIGAESPVAGAVEIHTMTMTDGIMRMRALPSVPLPAGEAVHLAPGGLHLMLIGLKRPLPAGETVPLTLVLERAGRVAVEMTVERPGARAPAAR